MKSWLLTNLAKRYQYDDDFQQVRGTLFADRAGMRVSGGPSRLTRRHPRQAWSCIFAALVVILHLAGCGESDRDPTQPSGTGSTAASAVTSGDDADYVAIPRTRVLLRVPDGMVVESSLPGFGRPGTRTGVVVTELPVQGKTPQQALEEMAGGFRGPRAAEKGLQLEDVQRIEVAGFPAIATVGTQRVAAETFAKVLVVMAASDTVVQLTGTIEPGDLLSAAELLGVLRAARWSAEPAPGDLGIDLTPAPGYQRQSDGTAGILLTFGGEAGAGVPKFLASRSMGKVRVDGGQLRAYAEARFGKLPSKPSVESTSEVKIAGLVGFETVGRGTRAAEVVYAVMLFTEDGYIIMAGDYDPARYPDQLPAFRAMAQSLVVD